MKSLKEIKEQNKREEVSHETWCAKVIAINSEVPFSVRCDCRKQKAHHRQETDMRPKTLNGSVNYTLFK